jgi:hypothetical protein
MSHRSIHRPLKSCLVLAPMLVFLLAASSICQAESWVFRQSYYSHDPVTEVRIGRQFSTGPVYTRPQGEYIKTGLRNLRSTIVTQGQTYDNLNVYESWIQVGSQF